MLSLYIYIYIFFLQTIYVNVKQHPFAKYKNSETFFFFIRNKTAKVTYFISKRQNAQRVRLYLTYFWCYIFHNFSLLITLCIELHCNLIILRHCFSRSLLIDLLPRIHVMIDFSIEKEIFLRIQDTSLNMVHLVFQQLFRRSESNIYCLPHPNIN